MEDNSEDECVLNYIYITLSMLTYTLLSQQYVKRSCWTFCSVTYGQVTAAVISGTSYQFYKTVNIPAVFCS